MIKLNFKKWVILIIPIIILGLLFFWILSNKNLVIKNTQTNAPSPVIADNKTAEIIVECDIFDDEQKEIIEIFEKDIYYALKVKRQQNVIFEKDLSYLRIDNWQIIDIDSDGKSELYIDGSGNRVMQKDIFKFTDGDMVSILNLKGTEVFFKEIEKNVENDQFTCSNFSEDTNLSCNGICILPSKLFYNIKKDEIPNNFLFTSYDWIPIKKDTSWYIDATATIKIKVGQFYWGPPTLNPKPSEYTDFYCDIARFHFILKNINSSFNPVEARLVLNYSETPMSNVDLLDYDEASFNNNIALLLPISEVYQSLGGINKEDNNDQGYSVKKINGVTLTGFVDNSIINIRVESDKFPTKRGLRVGDSIDDLKSLYGIPDQGFFEDDIVTYYFSSKNKDSGNISLNFYRKMSVKLKDGKITMIEFDQMASD